MLLSHKHQFLFVHIAKTGGTSVRDALSRFRWDARYGVPQFIVNKLSQLCGHKLGCRFPRHSKVIAAKEMLPAEYFAGLYKFAYVRNPWDLQVSSYHHIKRERPHLYFDPSTGAPAVLFPGALQALGHLLHLETHGERVSVTRPRLNTMKGT